MADTTVPPWLQWAREIEAISQSGLTYSHSDYDRERYRRLLEIAAEIVASHTQVPQAEVLHSFQMQPGYATPKVDVRGAALRNNQILLVQERTDGRWCLPGGWADVGQLPSDTAEREVREESGFLVKAQRIVGVYDANRGAEPLEFYHAYKIVFLCHILGGEARPSFETPAVGFFPFDKLPPLSIHRTNERHLHDVLACLHDPSRPSAFD
ncbi:MAG: NUDIX hydrolase [Chloroflexi bacterium]|nr:NUDIX hydrolase [Chloroflexota bacterium]